MTVFSRTVIPANIVAVIMCLLLAHIIMVSCLLHTLTIELLRVVPEGAAHAVQGLISQLLSFHQKPVLLAAGTISCMQHCCAGRILLHKLGNQQLVNRQGLQHGRRTVCWCVWVWHIS